MQIRSRDSSTLFLLPRFVITIVNYAVFTEIALAARNKYSGKGIAEKLIFNYTEIVFLQGALIHLAS